uniref:Uncharacterized protein n=1 Tax=viral metagenome TaxID=1070528 RepID=A0A6C0CWD4_9ZZZZ
MPTFVNSLKDSEDIESYIKTFNKKDREVRDLTLYSEYVQPFTLYEKWYLKILVIYMNSILYPFKFLYDIPWVFAKSIRGIENDYPHTHKDMIILPYDFLKRSRFSLVNTIIHEKVHIFQRYNMISTITLYLDYWGLVLESYEKMKDQRANPDINNINFSYFDPMINDRVITYNRYTNNAVSLKDSVVIQNKLEASSEKKSLVYFGLIQNDHYQTEHPNEVMACLIADKIMNKKKHKPTEKWIKNLYLKSNNR